MWSLLGSVLNKLKRKHTSTETDMLGGGLCRVFILFTLGVCCFHALEASVCKQHYGRVGGSIELSPDLPNKELTIAYWMYNSATKVADKNADIPGNPFSGRVALNPVNYSLTISGLYTNDSGSFTFISDKDGQQSPIQCMSLQVKDVLTQSPTLSVINVTRVSSESCEALLHCSTTQDTNVSYKWTVGNKTYSGSTLQYQIRPQEGDTNFKCTVANVVSEISVTRRINCNTTVQQVSLMIGLGCGAVLLVVLPLIVLCWYKNSKDRGCHRRTTETGQGGDQVENVQREATQEQLYSSLLHADDCVYESITGSRNNDDDGLNQDYKNVKSHIFS